MRQLLWRRDAIVCVFVLFNINKEDGADRKEDQGYMGWEFYEEEMEDVRLDDEREHHWRMG